MLTKIENQIKEIRVPLLNMRASFTYVNCSRERSLLCKATDYCQCMSVLLEGERGQQQKGECHYLGGARLVVNSFSIYFVRSRTSLKRERERGKAKLTTMEELIANVIKSVASC